MGTKEVKLKAAEAEEAGEAAESRSVDDEGDDKDDELPFIKMSELVIEE